MVSHWEIWRCCGVEYLKPLGKPVALWPCERQLVEMERCEKDLLCPLWVALCRDRRNCPRRPLNGGSHWHPSSYHACSTARSVKLIQDAKARGLPITVSTSWMHLLLDTKAVSNYDTVYV